MPPLSCWLLCACRVSSYAHHHGFVATNNPFDCVVASLPELSKKAREDAESKEKKKMEERNNVLQIKERDIVQEPTHLFLNYNTALGPPYRIILDTNFINLSISNKLDIFKNSMDCLLGKCEFMRRSLFH